MKNPHEHIGDGIVNLAARILIYEQFKSKIKFVDYRYWSTHIVSNKNLAHGGTKRIANFVEIKIGKRFFQEGLESSIEYAKQVLIETPMYKELRRAVASK